MDPESQKSLNGATEKMQGNILLYPYFHLELHKEGKSLEQHEARESEKVSSSPWLNFAGWSVDVQVEC